MNALLRRAHLPAFTLGASLLLAAVLLVAPIATAQVAQDLDAVHAAEQQHRPAPEVADMWARLALKYHAAADFLNAEDAYNRSLHLLKDLPDSRPLYAQTLDNLASLYLIFGHVDEAEGVRKQALAIRQELGNPADIGISEVHVADIAMARHNFKKAEQLASQGMKDMSAATPPPALGMLSALITMTYARCLRGHTADGLSSARQAFDFAAAHFAPNSPAIGFSLQTLGFAEWKNGDPDAGGKTMQHAVQMLRSQLVPSDPRLVGALMQYENYLVTSKREPEANEIRDEVSRTNIPAGAACATCTVSVYSLAKGLR